MGKDFLLRLPFRLIVTVFLLPVWFMYLCFDIAFKADLDETLLLEIWKGRE